MFVRHLGHDAILAFRHGYSYGIVREEQLSRAFVSYDC